MFSQACYVHVCIHTINVIKNYKRTDNKKYPSTGELTKHNKILLIRQNISKKYLKKIWVTRNIGFFLLMKKSQNEKIIVCTPKK